MKPQRFCIFCGLSGMSKEHFWPDWLKEYVPIVKDAKYTASVYSSKGLAAQQLRSSNQRQGHLITKTFRVVCKKCNNGWMSGIENDVKAFLLTGISNTETIVNQQVKEKLALWACVKAVITEHSEPESSLTLAEDRKALISGVLPSYFAVYLGKQSTKTITWLGRHSRVIAFGPRLNPPLPSGIHKNMQSVTFIVGNLVFHVLSVRVEGFILDTDISYPKMHRLWPPAEGILDTASIFKMNRSGVEDIVSSLNTYLSGQNARYGGDVPS